VQASRESLAQLLFEQFNVNGLYVTEAPVLTLYAAGKLTGTAVDIGAEKIGALSARVRKIHSEPSCLVCVTRERPAPPLPPPADVCPVYEGTMVGPGARRQEFGGSDLDAHLQQLLKSRCVSLLFVHTCTRPACVTPTLCVSRSRSHARTATTTAAPRHQRRGHRAGGRARNQGAARVCVRGASHSSSPALLAAPSRLWRTQACYLWYSCVQSAERFEEEVGAAGEGVSHTLPDGAVISVPALALASMGEALFDPCGMHGQPAAGLTDEILVSVKACINDYRRQMCVLETASAVRLSALMSLLLSRMHAGGQAGERDRVRRRAGVQGAGGATAERAHRSRARSHPAGACTRTTRTATSAIHARTAV
jgi:hypothetical protein